MSAGYGIETKYVGRPRSAVSLTPPVEPIQSSFIDHRAATDNVQSANWAEVAAARLGPKEFRRRLWHFVPGILALLGPAIPYTEPAPAYLVNGTVLFGLVLVGAAIYCQRSIRRAGERNCLPAILGYGITVIPMFLLFQSQPELAVTVAGILAFGDGSATLVGMLAGRKKLPWNNRKSWAGVAAFIVVALPVAIYIYWGMSVPRVSFGVALLCVVPSVLVGALVETMPTRFNDNIFVGLSAAATVIAMHGVMVGWS